MAVDAESWRRDRSWLGAPSSAVPHLTGTAVLIVELPDAIYSDDAKAVISPLLNSPRRFTEPVLRAIDENYHPFERGGVMFYVLSATSSPQPPPG